MMFDPQSYELRQWTITDAQGRDTTVMIFNVVAGRAVRSVDLPDQLPAHQRDQHPAPVGASRVRLFVECRPGRRPSGPPVALVGGRLSVLATFLPPPGFLMPFTVATWNINSAAAHALGRTLPGSVFQPDVLCLQETKCPADVFPFKPLKKLGYERIEISGQKGYHGVRRSRAAAELVEKRDSAPRATAATSRPMSRPAGAKILVHNFSFLCRRDEPDPEINPKFSPQAGLRRRNDTGVPADGIRGFCRDLWSVTSTSPPLET